MAQKKRLTKAEKEEKKRYEENVKKATEAFRHALKLHIRKVTTKVNKQYRTLIDTHFEPENTPEDWEERCKGGDVTYTEEWLVYSRNRNYLDILKKNYVTASVEENKYYDYQADSYCNYSDLYPIKAGPVTFKDFEDVYFNERILEEYYKVEKGASDNSEISAYIKISELCWEARRQYGLPNDLGRGILGNTYRLSTLRYRELHNIEIDTSYDSFE